MMLIRITNTIKLEISNTTSNITKNEKKIYACNYLTIVIEEL